MSHPFLLRHPSLESSSPQPSYDGHRASLFDAKDDFIARMGPIGVAAIYFGAFSLAPQDPAVSREALLKLSFAYRHFLQPAGLRFQVEKQIVTVTGTIRSRLLATLAELLARQIDGVVEVKNETELALEDRPAATRSLDALHLLLATDQALRSQVKITETAGELKLTGSVTSDTQKSWAEQLAHLVDAQVISELQIAATETPLKTTEMDDDSIQALVLFRLRLTRETEPFSLTVASRRGVVTLTGKVRTAALQKQAENLARTTLGVSDLHSLITVTD